MKIDYFKNRSDIKYKAFFDIAQSLSKLSKDTRGIGAVIVSRQGNIIGTGYNGAPFGFDDDKIPKTKEKQICNCSIKVSPKNLDAGNTLVNTLNGNIYSLEELMTSNQITFKIGALLSKYEWTRHAEVNAIRDALRSNNAHLLPDSILFCTRFPCVDCALSIAEASISEVHVPYDLSFDVDSNGINFYCIGEGSTSGMSTLRLNESLTILKHKSVKVHFNNYILS